MIFRIGLFLILFLLFPVDLFAWGPAMHLKLGLSIIDNLKILSPDIVNIISNNVGQFLYGCVSADIIQAKKLLKYVENCHNWKNGFKLLRSAKSSSLKSFALGYLCHLSADVVAHNCFVPAKIVETYSKRGLKHFLWEMRFDMEMFDQESKKQMKEIIKQDHSSEDELMNGLLKTALFSFRTNKRIFSSLLFVQRMQKWQESMNEMYVRNNYYLSEEDIGHYFKLSMDAMLSFLIDSKKSKYVEFDPTGKSNLKKAIVMMKDLKKKEKSGTLEESYYREVLDGVNCFKNEFL